MPVLAKVLPDKQLYAEWEVTKNKKEREANRQYFEQLNKHESHKQSNALVLHDEEAGGIEADKEGAAAPEEAQGQIVAQDQVEKEKK